MVICKWLNNKDIIDLTKTLKHEIFGHIGINHLDPKQKQELLNSIKNEFSNPNSDFKEYIDFVNNNKDYKNQPPTIKAEEVFAFIAQDIEIKHNYKFTPFENKLDGSSREKVENIIQNIIAGIRENKLEIQKENTKKPTQSQGMNR